MRHLVAILALLSGCALLQKAEPVEPVYLSPAELEGAPPEDRARHPDLAVRLRSVRASDHLERRVVVRDDHEVRFLETARWTMVPSELVERRVSRALFERRGLTRIVGGAGPTLEIRVRAFELILDDATPRARVRLTCLLHDERRSLFQETFTVERPTEVAAGDPPVGPPFAEATRAALDEAVRRLVVRLIRALSDDAG